MLTSDQLNRYRAKLKPQHTTEEHKKEIGGNLQRARKKTGLTQEDVAEILGWGGRKVGRIESGETLCSPDVNTDDVVHTARSSSACFPAFQCMLSAA